MSVKGGSTEQHCKARRHGRDRLASARFAQAGLASGVLDAEII